VIGKDFLSDSPFKSRIRTTRNVVKLLNEMKALHRILEKANLDWMCVPICKTRKNNRTLEN